MKYTVVWLPSAQDELARIWLGSSDRQAVTAASNHADRTLRTDPEAKGSSLPGRHLLWIPPLALTFEVSPDDRMVKVVQVRLVPG